MGKKKQYQPEDMRFFTPADICEMRIKKTASGDTLEGYAAIFNQAVQIGGEKWGWKESVSPGAFKKTIQEGDIRGLINHNSDLILARTSSGTLKLVEDAKGLHYQMDLGQQSYSTDLRESVERGDITGNSFSFRTIREEWNEDDDERRLLEVQLFDVGPVTFPANEGTSLNLRSILGKSGVNVDDLAGVLAMRSLGMPLNPSAYEILNSSIRTLEGFIKPQEPERKKKSRFNLSDLMRN